MTNIGVNVRNPPFRDLPALEKITVDSRNLYYKFAGGLLLTKDGKEVVAVPEGREYVFIPDSVMHIPHGAFDKCKWLDRSVDKYGIKSIDGWIVGYDADRLSAQLVLTGYRGIADGAIRYCDGLTSVTISEGLKVIGGDAFCECVKLSSVTIPASVTFIGEGAFGGAVKLKSITLASGNVNYKYSGELLLSVDNAQLIAVSRNATTVNIPEGVTRIPCYFFVGCTKLTEVNIPLSMSEIDGEAFFWDCYEDEVGLGCPALKTISVADGNQYFRSANGMLLGLESDDYDGWGLLMVPQSLADIVIPEGVAWIGDEGAFAGCTKATSITIPSSLVDGLGFGGWASPFYPCNKLKSFVVATGNKWFSAKDGMLVSKDGVLLDVPRGLMTQKTVTIPSGIRRIGDSALEYFNQLTSVVIPEGVEEIGNGAFYGCDSLAKLTLPQSLKVIERNAFDGCPIKSVSIPDNVTQVGTMAFNDVLGRDMNSIPGLVLVDGWVVGVSDSLWDDYSGPTEYLNDALQSSRVRGIAGGAFVDCKDLLHLTLPECVKSVPDDMCYRCWSLEWIEIPDGVTEIGNYAFYGCDNLAEVTIPDGVTRIGTHAFHGCGNLSKVTIPDGVRHVGYEAFSGCDGLIDYESIPGLGIVDGWIVDDNGILSVLAEDESFDGTFVISGEMGIHGIADWVFDSSPLVCDPISSQGLSDVTSLVVDNGVVSIGAYAFIRCSNLTNVNVSASVEYIGEYAFSDCKNLQTVFLPGTLRGAVPKTAFPTGTKVFYYREDGTISDTCLVFFNANGGELDETDATRSIKEYAVVGELPIPIRPRYIFDGWFTESEGGEKVSPSTEIFKDSVFYAHWTDVALDIDIASAYVANDDGAFFIELAESIYSTSTPKLTVKSLPSGLKYNANTMTISGKATKPGVYTVTVSATNATVKKPVTKTFELTVPNLVDDEIPVADKYGPYIPGKTYVETITNAASCTVTGLPIGMKWTAKAVNDRTFGAIPANSVYGAATKPGNFTVYFTKTVKETNEKGKQVSVKHTATATFVVGPFPKLTIDVVGTGTGKVTGAGEYAANKKVSLKATADTKDAAATATKPATVKSVFMGWYDGETLLSQSASYSLVMPETDVAITAKFATAAEDAASIGLKVDGVDMAAAVSPKPPYQTNVWCGVYLEWPVAASALSATLWRESGPAGWSR